MARRILEVNGHSWSFSYDTIPAPPWEGVIPNYFRTVVRDPDPFNTSQAAVPKRVFDCVGLFPVGVRRGEDTDMWCRIALRFPIALSTQIGGVYHRDADNRASLGARPRNHRVIETLDRALEPGSLPAGAPVKDMLEYRNKLHTACARNCVLEGFPGEARAHLQAAASTVLLRRARRYWYVRSFVPRFLENCAQGVERFIDRRARS